MKTTVFGLKEYSFFSGIFLIISNQINGQVIYTDVEPDTIFDATGEGAYLDIDNNGTFEFTVVNYSFTFTTYSYSDIINRQDILAGPFISANALAGFVNHYSTFSGGWTWYFPYALTQGEVVNDDLEWQTAGIQIMALRDYANGNTTRCYFCSWYNEEISVTIDHYLGIRFIGEDEMDHYGWIRCDVLDEGRMLVVKDYAYETQPERYIIAGDTIGATDISDSNDLIANIYSFNSSIYIQINQQPANMNLKVFDLSGKNIYATQIEEIFTAIKLESATGNYFVELVEGDKKVIKKVFII